MKARARRTKPLTLDDCERVSRILPEGQAVDNQCINVDGDSYRITGTRVSLDSVVYDYLGGLSPESIADNLSYRDAIEGLLRVWSNTKAEDWQNVLAFLPRKN